MGMSEKAYRSWGGAGHARVIGGGAGRQLWGHWRWMSEWMLSSQVCAIERACACSASPAPRVVPCCLVPVLDSCPGLSSACHGVVGTPRTCRAPGRLSLQTWFWNSTLRLSSESVWNEWELQEDNLFFILTSPLLPELVVIYLVCLLVLL